MTKRALITGITGQDGAYLAQLLHGKGYELFGLVARRGTESLWRLRELGVEQAVSLIQGDLTDLSSLFRAKQRGKVGQVALDQRYRLFDAELAKPPQGFGAPPRHQAEQL